MSTLNSWFSYLPQLHCAPPADIYSHFDWSQHWMQLQNLKSTRTGRQWQIETITSQIRGQESGEKRRACRSSPFSDAASAYCPLSWAAGVSWIKRPSHHGPCSRWQRQHEELTYDHLDAKKTLNATCEHLTKGGIVEQLPLFLITRLIRWNRKIFNTVFNLKTDHRV